MFRFLGAKQVKDAPTLQDFLLTFDRGGSTDAPETPAPKRRGGKRQQTWQEQKAIAQMYAEAWKADAVAPSRPRR